MRIKREAVYEELINFFNYGATLSLKPHMYDIISVPYEE